VAELGDDVDVRAKDLEMQRARRCRRYGLVDDRIRDILAAGESVVRDNADRLTSRLVLATEEQ
jgi:hypothetical protein